MRLRWVTALPEASFGTSNNVLTPITAPVAKNGIEIIFEEGQDIGPDNFGAAVLDNIDLNAVLVERSGQQS